ncbi:MAG: DUF1573 domain-containing protein [Cytophagaceae bacterium]
MVRKVIFFIPVLFAALTAFSQGNFEFKTDKHDFGIVEEGIQAEYEFEFTNTGDAPIVLTDVRASCGCTTPSWTREPVKPGEKGHIKASYNSVGRIGVFNKSITITSNATEASKVVYIKGIVVKKDTTAAPTPEKLKTSPKISFEKSSHNFGKIERGQKVAQKFTIKNVGKTPLSINSFQAACSCVTIQLPTEPIAPGKSIVVEMIYSPSYDGLNTDIVTFFTNDLASPRFAVTLQGEVVENLSNVSPLKEDKSNVPFGK